MDFNQNFASADNDSLTQDSLFLSNDPQAQNGSAANTMRAIHSKTPINVLNNSSNFQTIKAEDNIFTDNVLQMTPIPKKDSRCQRDLKPSQRTKVIMTRSVDQETKQNSIIGSQGHNSIFGSKAGDTTARMHLNHNTTLELIDNVPRKFTPRSKMSPFSMK